MAAVSTIDEGILALGGNSKRVSGESKSAATRGICSSLEDFANVSADVRVRISDSCTSYPDAWREPSRATIMAFSFLESDFETFLHPRRPLRNPRQWMILLPHPLSGSLLIFRSTGNETG